MKKPKVDNFFIEAFPVKMVIYAHQPYNSPFYSLTHSSSLSFSQFILFVSISLSSMSTCILIHLPARLLVISLSSFLIHTIYYTRLSPFLLCPSPFAGLSFKHAFFRMRRTRKSIRV